MFVFRKKRADAKSQEVVFKVLNLMCKEQLGFALELSAFTACVPLFARKNGLVEIFKDSARTEVLLSLIYFQAFYNNP